MRAARRWAALAAVLLAASGCAQGVGETAAPEGTGEPAPEPAEQEVEELECFDADYAIEPTFDTPEEALEHALEMDAPERLTPPDLDAYDRVDRPGGWVEFAFGDGENEHHTWGITRDEDGRWGTTSLGGCIPAG